MRPTLHPVSWAGAACVQIGALLPSPAALFTLLAIASPLAVTQNARAQSEDITGRDQCVQLMNAQLTKELNKSPRLGTSAAAETIWVGFNENQTSNYWRVGKGPARYGIDDAGMWTFDRIVHGDSLQGWWSIREPHMNFSGTTLTDEQRPWWTPSFGNMVNYVAPMRRDPSDPIAPGNRTFGVIGVWHRDPGNVVASSQAGTNPTAPTWTPLQGSYSAWMGIRAHGDRTVQDPETGNYFDQSIAQFNTPNSSSTAGHLDQLLPGYLDMLDQMLYRDIDLAGAPADSGVRLIFTFRTNMSTNKWTVDRFRTGWHEGDPLSQNQVTPGNFISAEADNGGGPASAAPIDSFQVYIGAPVDDAGWLTSIDDVRSVEDPQRRWFNEILQRDDRRWLYGTYGDNAPQTVVVQIGVAEKAALLTAAANAGHPNRLRIVFRVHTNGLGSDERGSYPGNYNSGKAGAAVLDDVRVDVGFGQQVVGDFEAPSSIDNATAVDPLNAWKSTGKPPQPFCHPHDLATLVYQDICGPVGSPNRICNMEQSVISLGLHDMNEASSDPAPLSPDHEGNWSIVSPTINLAGADENSLDPTPNNQGLTAEERYATKEYHHRYEIYSGYFDVFSQGQVWQAGWQSYPAMQSDGTIGWGPIHAFFCLYFNPEKQCFAVVDGGYVEGLIRTSNPNGRPDSLRVYFKKLSQCYRFGITTGCSSTDGGYIDNFSVGIEDGAPVEMTYKIWDIYNDTFPANENPGLPGTAAFDTAAAHVKIGLNVAQTTNDLFRYNVPGDSLVITAPADSARVDLLFRIRPGVGNHVTIGDPASGLRGDPTSAVPHAAGYFWGSYKNNPGTYSGLPGAVNPGAAIAAHASAPSGWSPIVWNSARLDTSEINGHATFPVQRILIGRPPSGQEWSGTYHEDELAVRPTVAIARNRCFVIDTTNTDFIASNITCGQGTYPPAYIMALPPSYTGYNGSTTTTEGTKIIPDGLLTPGAHVQYFLRKQRLDQPPSQFVMVPDTNAVSPQPTEFNTDGHRWQHFSVLPDRWKEPAFGGVGMACMLVYDDADRRGPERVWKGVADSIGATAAAAVGGSDGYGGTPGNGDPNDPAYWISDRNAQPGTTWDMYAMKASESLTTSAQRIGGRLGYRATGFLMDDGAGNGKWTYNPPTVDMMNAYYRLLVILTGDLNSGVWGPFFDATADDILLFQSWLLSGDPGTPTRGILVIGESFVESAYWQGSSQQSFVSNYLGTQLVDPNYLLFVPDSRFVVDVKPGAPYPPGDVYGLNNTCLSTNDVVAANLAVPNTSVNLEYVTPDGTLLPLGVHKAHDVTNPWISQTISADIESMRGRYGTTNGRLAWLYNTFTNVFGAVCQVAGSPLITLDTPQDSRGTIHVDFANLRNNPLRAGSAVIDFGLASDDRVEIKVYDVSGRLVRTLADRLFKAGEHKVLWDGMTDGGAPAARGVYFTRIKYQRGFDSTKKLTVLK